MNGILNNFFSTDSRLEKKQPVDEDVDEAIEAESRPSSGSEPEEPLPKLSDVESSQDWIDSKSEPVEYAAQEEEVDKAKVYNQEDLAREQSGSDDDVKDKGEVTVPDRTNEPPDMSAKDIDGGTDSGKKSGDVESVQSSASEDGQEDLPEERKGFIEEHFKNRQKDDDVEPRESFSLDNLKEAFSERLEKMKDALGEGDIKEFLFEFADMMTSDIWKDIAGGDTGKDFHNFSLENFTDDIFHKIENVKEAFQNGDPAGVVDSVLDILRTNFFDSCMGKDDVSLYERHMEMNKPDDLNVQEATIDSTTVAEQESLSELNNTAADQAYQQSIDTNAVQETTPDATELGGGQVNIGNAYEGEVEAVAGEEAAAAAFV